MGLTRLAQCSGGICRAKRTLGTMLLGGAHKARVFGAVVEGKEAVNVGKSVCLEPCVSHQKAEQELEKQIYAKVRFPVRASRGAPS